MVKKLIISFSFIFLLGILFSSSILAITLPSFYCGDRIVSNYPDVNITEKCDPGLDDSLSPSEKLFNDANCNSPGTTNECQCYSGYTNIFNSQQWSNCCPTNVLRNASGACCAFDDLVVLGKCVSTLVTGPCGNGILDSGEECDMANGVYPWNKTHNFTYYDFSWPNSIVNTFYPYYQDNPDELIKNLGLTICNMDSCKCPKGYNSSGELTIDNQKIHTCQKTPCPEGLISGPEGDCVCPAGTVPNTQEVSTNFFTNIIDNVVAFFTNSPSPLATSPTNTVTCTAPPAVPCNKTQTYACWDKCQVCLDGTTGVCGPSSSPLYTCGPSGAPAAAICCANKTNIDNPGIKDEACKSKIGLYYCNKTCISPETPCGDANCCDVSSGSSTACRKIEIYDWASSVTPFAGPLGIAGYCTPKVCSTGTQAFDKKCRPVSPGSSDHVLCCPSNTHCGLRSHILLKSSVPTCVADSCPGQEICTGTPSGRPVSLPVPYIPPALPVVPIAPTRVDTSGTTSICCPLGTCTVSTQGIPRCTPPTILPSI